MSEQVEKITRPTDPVGRVIYQIAQALAILGGVLLCAMAALTVVSISGRVALSAPVPGDFELVAIGTGLAVFAFLPWCQLSRSNVLVDFFMTKAPVRARIVADIAGGICYLLIAALLTWRLTFGAIDMRHYGEVTMTINFPRWTTFPVAVALLAFLVVVIAYTLGRSVAELRAGRYFDE